MIVNSENSWGKLKSVVVGKSTNARFPINDPLFSNQAISTTWDKTPFPQGDFPEHVIQQSTEDLTQLSSLFESLGVEVHRPTPLFFDMETSTYDWDTDGMYCYCPRDVLLVVGNKVIEAPMPYRARQQEVRAYEFIKRQAIKDKAVWISAPKPTLLDHEVKVEDGKIVLTEEYPLFEAANVCRLGKDLLYLVSSTGNYVGAEWLQGVLGSEYKVHITDNVYSHAHIDSTIIPLEEGKVLLNGIRVDETNCPEVFKDWEKIYVQTDEIIKQYYHEYPYSSKWLAINMITIEPGVLLMEDGQPYLKKKLENHGFEVLTTPMRMARTLGGGVHCTTLDLYRE